MWELSLAWYADRLDPAYRTPPPEHYQALLDRVGLVDEFWRLVP